MTWRHLLPLVVTMVLCVPAASGSELDQHGGSHDWKGSPGAHTVIDFAASWCAPCRKVLPRLEAFARSHREVRILVVSVDERQEGRDRLVESLDLTLPVIWDEESRIAEHYQPRAMPATFVIDPDGRVVYSHTGSDRRSWDEFVAFVESLSSEE